VGTGRLSLIHQDTAVKRVGNKKRPQVELAALSRQKAKQEQQTHKQISMPTREAQPKTAAVSLSPSRVAGRGALLDFHVNGFPSPTDPGHPSAPPSTCPFKRTGSQQELWFIRAIVVAQQGNALLFLTRREARRSKDVRHQPRHPLGVDFIRFAELFAHPLLLQPELWPQHDERKSHGKQPTPFADGQRASTQR